MDTHGAVTLQTFYSQLQWRLLAQPKWIRRYGMKMTLDIDEKKVEEAMAAYGVETKTAVIDLALRELLRKKAVEQLMSMQGKFPNFRTNDEIEAAEKRHYARTTRR